jgi:hypothetical protein
VNDNAPDPVALTDQAIEHDKQLARQVAAYNKALRSEGLPAKLANDLTLEYQDELFAMERRAGT